MKKYLFALSLFASLAACLVVGSRPASGQVNGLPTYEYVTIRWGGRENTHLIRANGSVEMLKPLLAATFRPDRTDERSFYMNIAMNAVAREGYEFAGMTTDEIVMKRAVHK
jgi:hypothetical protein